MFLLTNTYTTMENWFAALSLVEKIYWVTALVSSVIFIVLIILTLIGGDADDMGGDAVSYTHLTLPTIRLV